MTSISAPPTVVLVHGALTDASIWRDVTTDLLARNVRVLAPAMPLRGLATDAEYLRRFLQTVDGPVVVAGHSYGGSVISDPAALTPAVRALVYVAAFQPDLGETTGELNSRFPGSGLSEETTVVRTGPGGDELYLRPERFAEVYAADLEPDTAAALAVAQRPISPGALGEPLSGPATWRPGGACRHGPS
jgi:pimeloyl-ACP methyl ester carboxylesterase